MPNGRFCAAPFNSLELFNDGTVVPCCKFDPTTEQELKDFSIKEYSLHELSESPPIRRIRQQFMNGEEPVGCGVCWKEEAVGIKSLRQHRTPDENQRLFNMEYLDFKFTNLCNLKCRICNPHCSSTWVVEHKVLFGTSIEKFKAFAERKFFANRANITALNHWLDTTKNVGFFGGEPLMQPEHKEVLEVIAAHPRARNIQFYYNTNCTQFDDDLLRLWAKIGRVNLHMSVDDTGDRFTYQRFPAGWLEAQQTIAKFKYRAPENVHVVLYTTVSVFNVMYLMRLLEWNDSTFRLPVIFNMLHQPKYLGLRLLSSVYRGDIVRQLARYRNAQPRDRTTTTSIDQLIGFIDKQPEPTPELIGEFYRVTHEHDRFRKQSFEDTFPELHEALQAWLSWSA